MGYPSVYLEGNIDDFYKITTTNRELVTISNYYSLSISINGNKIPDFSTVHFKMDNTSYIDLSSDLVKIRAKKISELQIFRSPFSKITLQGDEGNLLVKDRAYYINSDNIDFKINSKYPSSISVVNSEVNFDGYVNSGKINNNNIIHGILFYWFDQETEKISVLIAFILLIATLLYVCLIEKNIKQTEKIIEQTKTEKRFDDNEKLLMHVYSPMEVILTKFELGLGFEYISQSPEPHEIPSEYNSLFQEMNDNLLEIKRNYGYLFDQDLIQLHNEVWKLWKQYLNSDDPENITIYDTLNSSITRLHNLITNKIKSARKKRDEIIENSYS